MEQRRRGSGHLVQVINSGMGYDMRNEMCMNDDLFLRSGWIGLWKLRRDSSLLSTVRTHIGRTYLRPAMGGPISVHIEFMEFFWIWAEIFAHHFLRNLFLPRHFNLRICILGCCVLVSLQT